MCLGLADIKAYLLLQRIQVWFLPPTSYGSQVPVIPVPGDLFLLLASTGTRRVHMCLTNIYVGTYKINHVCGAEDWCALHCEAQNYWDVPAALYLPFFVCVFVVVLIEGLTVLYTSLKLLGSSDLLSLGTADSYHCAQHLQCLLSCCFVCSFVFLRQGF